MGYKSELCQSKDYVCESMKNNKDPKLLYRVDNTYIEVKDHLAYVKKINYGRNGKISELELVFANGKTARTFTYTDTKKIKVGQIISVIGYFEESQYGLLFKARGGSNPLITNAKELSTFNLLQTHKMGIITGLSEVEMPKRYHGIENIVKVGDTNFYYMITDIEKDICEDVEIDENSVDTRFMNYVNTELYDCDTSQVEDFVDIEEEYKNQKI